MTKNQGITIIILIASILFVNIIGLVSKSDYNRGEEVTPAPISSTQTYITSGEVVVTTRPTTSTTTHTGTTAPLTSSSIITEPLNMDLDYYETKLLMRPTKIVDMRYSDTVNLDILNNEILVIVLKDYKEETYGIDGDWEIINNTLVLFFNKGQLGSQTINLVKDGDLYYLGIKLTNLPTAEITLGYIVQGKNAVSKQLNITSN